MVQTILPQGIPADQEALFVPSDQPECSSFKPKDKAKRNFLRIMIPKIVLVISLIALVNVYGDEENRRVRQHDPTLVTSPKTLELIVNESKELTFEYKKDLSADLVAELGKDQFVSLSEKEIHLNSENKSQTITVKGVSVTSRTYLNITSCTIEGQGECPVTLSKVFVTTVVMHSYVLKVLVQITGWIYFIAWSISFYPQIWLNFERKSVEGLNFDFLLLNIIGFTCYTIYNSLMFFDPEVQALYIESHPRALIPVLTNDVVFAIHALTACIVTGLQCFIYERGNQRVSYICWGWSSLLVLVAIGGFASTLFSWINWLTFINVLSYIKLAVTCSKYVPQAILNFRRKSTVGWSIGNILLDFTGGTTDILQMILQASNTDDWSAFYGNVVKFGLGLVSMIFDVLFMIQHYCLYRNSEGFELEKDQNESVETTTTNLRINA